MRAHSAAELNRTIDSLIRERDALAAELAHATQRVANHVIGANTLRAKVASLEAALRAFMPEGIEQVCDDCGGHAAKCGQGCPVWDARALLAPVSTLCAICDQIQELHPSTHEWTAKPTSETKGDAG